MDKRCLCCTLQLTAHAHSEYHPHCHAQLFGDGLPPVFPYALTDFEALGRAMLMQREAVTGAQLKISAGIARLPGAARLTLVNVDDTWADYIVKPPTNRFPSISVCEHITMRLAFAIGLPVVPHGLLRLSDGTLSYITRRVDRSPQGPIHQEDFCQLLELPSDEKYSRSYERIAKRMYELKTPAADLQAFFALVIFCFLTGNADMHLKNFSLTHALPVPRLTPAYDLLNTTLLNPADAEETALTLNGRKRKLTRADFEVLGNACYLNQRQIANTLKRIATSVQQKAPGLLQQSFLHPELQREYVALVAERFKTLGIAGQRVFGICKTKQAQQFQVECQLGESAMPNGVSGKPCFGLAIASTF